MIEAIVTYKCDVPGCKSEERVRVQGGRAFHYSEDVDTDTPAEGWNYAGSPSILLCPVHLAIDRRERLLAFYRRHDEECAK